LEADYERLGKEWFEATGGNVEEGEEADNLTVDELTLTEKGKGKSKKPAFYDVAYNYVVAFDMEAIAKKAGLRGGEEAETMEVEEDSKVEEKKAEEEQQSTPSKRGWGFGLFGRR